MGRQLTMRVLDEAARKGWLTVENGAVTVTESSPDWIRTGIDIVNLGESVRANTVVLSAVASNAIQNHYRNMGQFNSPLGLPIDRAMRPRLRNSDGAYVTKFRGGEIVYLRDGRTQAYMTRMVTVYWRGFTCTRAQESTDEVYGTVSAIQVASGASQTIKYPADGDAEQSFDVGHFFGANGVIYQGPPTVLSLVVAHVEADSGDVSETKRRISEFIQSKAKDVAASNGAGFPAEDGNNDDWFLKQIVDWSVGALVDLVGAQDDRYRPALLPISFSEIYDRQYTDKTAILGGNPVKYTHSIVVRGVDDGGDEGEYVHYFFVEQQETTARPI
jgi:hypothetical protein